MFPKENQRLFFEKQHGHGLRDKKNGAGKNPAPYMKAGSVIKETLIYSNQYESILLILLVLRCFLAPPLRGGALISVSLRVFEQIAEEIMPYQCHPDLPERQGHLPPDDPGRQQGSPRFLFLRDILPDHRRITRPRPFPILP